MDMEMELGRVGRRACLPPRFHPFQRRPLRLPSSTSVASLALLLPSGPRSPSRSHLWSSEDGARQQATDERLRARSVGERRGETHRPSCDGGGGGRGREWHGEHGGVEFCSATILLLAPRSASVDPHTSADAASPSPLATSTPSAPAYISKAGGYEKEDKAARAYDPGALKYWGANATTKALTSLKTATSERPRRCKT